MNFSRKFFASIDTRSLYFQKLWLTVINWKLDLNEKNYRSPFFRFFTNTMEVLGFFNSNSGKATDASATTAEDDTKFPSQYSQQELRDIFSSMIEKI